MTIEEAVQDVLISRSQIESWERRYDALGIREQAIAEERLKIKVLIDAARALLPPEPVETAPPKGAPLAVTRRRRRAQKKRVRSARLVKSPPAEIETPLPAITAEDVRPSKGHRAESEWKRMIRLIVATAPNQPVSYSEAKAEVRKSELGDKFQQSDKGFYNAISRLHKAAEIIAYKGHLFTPESYSQFKQALDAGRVRDLKIENVAHHSPVGDAILKILDNRKDGAESGNLIWELRNKAGFASAIEKNKSHPYNVLARLVRTGEIVRRGKRYYRATPDNEAPAEMASASVGSESRELPKQPRLNNLP